jgi:hypothetical protein
MIVIDYKNKLKDAKLWGAELLRYQGKCELAEELLKWNPPRFPVSGDTLKKEGVPGKNIKDIYFFLYRSLSFYKVENQ